MSTVADPSSSRSALIERLHQASVAEHSLCCQYLFAAFSLRRTAEDYPPGLDPQVVQRAMSATQRWATTIFFVARQEMEHLGIATNLLSAIGEPPHLVHGDYPDASLTELLQTPMVLERCNEATLRRFQFIERPQGVLPGPFPAVETIYLDIKRMFTTLPAAELFTGDGERQVDQSDVELGVSMKILPVTSRATAAEAIDLVLAQGEGLGDSPLDEDTHFARFTQALTDYEQVAAQLGMDEFSYPVVPNPTATTGPQGSTRVTHEFSRALMEMFDDGYRLMLVMLREFFWGFRAYSGLFEAVEALATPEQIRRHRRVKIMAENAYFPFMTMFIRPIGELLARQPAFEDPRDPARAGPSFRTGPRIPAWEDVARYLDAMGRLQSKANLLQGHAPDEQTRQALVYLYQNLARMRSNIEYVWTQG